MHKLVRANPFTSTMTWLFLLILLLATITAVGCTRAQTTFPVRGNIEGIPIQTSVDSAAAKYYLENNLGGTKNNPQWDSAIATIHASLGNQLPTTSELKELTHRYSSDFAALILIRQLFADSNSRPLVAAYYKELEWIRKTGPQEINRPLASDYLILLVPGWLYKSDSTSGADMAQHRKALSDLGIRLAFADIAENGTVEDNATWLAQNIQQLSRTHDKIIIVSASKAGPEVALALTQLKDTPETHHVKAWINVGGILKGTALANTALTWPTRWFVYAFVLHGKSFEGIKSLATERSVARFKNLAIPANVLIVNYLAIPLSGQVSERAQGGYNRLRADGPNDGLTYITDAIAPGSLTIPELGTDHFFNSADADLRTIALTRVVMQYLSGTQQ